MMIVVRIKGGLGNQMFQYAVGLALSKRLSQGLVFNLAETSNMTSREYKLPQLKVETSKKIDIKELPWKIRLYQNKYVNKFMRVFNKDKHIDNNFVYWIETKETLLVDFFSIDYSNIYLDGYFQTPKYFEKYRKELLYQFRPSYIQQIEYFDELNKIKSTNSVAVHVRRSDFKKDYNKFHYLLNKEYYVKAIDFMKNKLKKPQFFVFSDDIAWAHENLNLQDVVFVKLHTEHCDIDEMMLMKHCNNIIIANSTFSWWAAWLNENENAIVICPLKSFGNDKMIPNNWIKI